MGEQFQASLGYLAATGDGRGLGVFASRDIEMGETVEVAPVLLLKTDFDDLETAIKQRVFNWHRLASFPGTSAIALGYGSMYNHDNPANMQYRAQLDGQAVAFIAVRLVTRGEELTINYNATGGEPVSVEDVWFNECGVIPLVRNTGERSTNSP